MKAAAAWILLIVGLGATDEIPFGPDEPGDDKYKLPEHFLFGAGTSSYQTEGAWNVNGKGENVFDYQYNKDGTATQENGDVAADAYNHVDDDIKMIDQLKLQVYRFSLSWARLLPDGNASNPNPDGIRYYNSIINKLIDINVQPMITMYHFDHPQAVHEKTDSWLGSGMIDAFVEFADYAFKSFGDRVKYWTTLNEPNMYCSLTYGGGLPPGNRSEPVNAYYTCIHNMVLAHAKSYRLYQEKYASTQQGMVGMTCNADISRPNTTKYEDVQAASRASAFGTGICAAPIIFGDYPEIVIKMVDEKSKEENRTTSRLPHFTDEEKQILKNSTDFLGLNVYYGHVVADSKTAGNQTNSGGGGNGPPNGGGNGPPNGGGNGPPNGGGNGHHHGGGGMFGHSSDDDAVEVGGVSGGIGGFGNAFSRIDSWAMRETLLYARDNYNNIPIFITENGYEDSDTEGIHDQNRAAYHSAYLRALAVAINEDNVNCIGITVWSLVDDYEWGRAYKSKMGLVRVDYSSSNRTRMLKDSSAFFIKLARDRKVPLVEQVPDSTSTASVSRSARNYQLLIVSAFLIKLIL